MILRTLLLLNCLSCLLAPSAVLAAGVPENDMKAAFLYNFALFTEWPAISADNIKLCVLKNDKKSVNFEVIKNKTVNGKSLQILTVEDATVAKDCQLLFVSDYKVNELAAILTALGTAPVLTVSDTKGAASQGLMVELVLENKLMGFEVNAKAARQANVLLSAKLLRLAKTVY